MNADPGDWLVVEASHLGAARRRGLILEIHGDDGAPPYLVRWTDSAHEALVFPGTDAHIEHATNRTASIGTAQ